MRAACLVNDSRLPAWKLRCLEEIAGIPNMEVRLYKTGTEGSRPKATIADRLDKKWFSGSPDPLELAKVSEPLPPVSVAAPPWREYDVTVNLSDSPAPDEAARCPYGMWEYRFHARKDYIVTELCVVAVNRERVRKCSKTAFSELSAFQNKAQLYWKVCHMIPSELQKISSCIEFRDVKATEGRLKLPMDAFAPPGGAAAVLRKKLILRREKDMWWIRLYRGQVGFEDLEKAEYFDCPQPAGLFRADPFLFEYEGEDWLFFEELSLSDWKGYLCAARIEAGGLSAPVKVLEAAWHLSYPFVFRHGKNIYLIPESSSTRTVDLYQCVSFPGKWEKRAVLLEGMHFADTTLHYHNGLWWLFTCAAHTRDYLNRDDLFLYYAEDPVGGPWTPHPMNPVVCDTCRARPAGRIVEIEDTLWRPSQDNSKRYGYGLNWNRIRRMDKEAYEEETVSRLHYDEETGIAGTHTYNASARWTVTDLLRKVRKSG